MEQARPIGTPPAAEINSGLGEDFPLLSACGGYHPGRRGAAGRAARVREGPRLSESLGRSCAAQRLWKASCWMTGRPLEAASVPRRGEPRRTKRRRGAALQGAAARRGRTCRTTQGRPRGGNAHDFARVPRRPGGSSQGGDNVDRSVRPWERQAPAWPSRGTRTARTRTVPRWSVAFPGGEHQPPSLLRGALTRPKGGDAIWSAAAEGEARRRRFRLAGGREVPLCISISSTNASLV